MDEFVFNNKQQLGLEKETITKDEELSATLGRITASEMALEVLMGAHCTTPTLEGRLVLLPDA